MRIEILDLKCVLCHVIGVQIETKMPLYNRHVGFVQEALYTNGHGES